MGRLRHLLPSFNGLITFEAVVRCGTFARAASELGVTGPAVSRTVSRLEAHLGIALFHRTSTGVILTEEGSALFTGISTSFGEIEKTLLRLRQGQYSGIQTVVVSASSAFATHWFMPRLADFKERFPKVEMRFQLISGPLGGSVNGADIAMRFGHGSGPRYLARVLMQELLVPVRAPCFHGAETQAGAFLPAVDRTINLGNTKPDWSSLFSDGAPVTTAGGLQFSDYAVVVQAALLGQGVALGWLNVVSHLLAHGDLVPAGSLMATGRTCELVVARKPQTSVVTEICEWIAAEYQADLERISILYPASNITSLNAQQERMPDRM